MMITVKAMLAAIGRSILFLAMGLVLAATGQAFAENAVTGMRTKTGRLFKKRWQQATERRSARSMPMSS